MSISIQSKKVLNNLLDNLEESNGQLQNLLHDYITQVTTTTRTWMDDPSVKNMTFKEAVAMVSAANMTLAEHIDMISVLVTNPPLTTAQTSADERKPLQQTQVGHDSKVTKEQDLTNLTSRLDQLEAKFSSIPNTKQLIDKEIIKLQQWKDQFTADFGLKVEKMSKKQKQNFKNLGKQLNEQDNRIKELNQEIEHMKGDKCLEVYANRVESIVKEVSLHSELIANLQENEKANVAVSTDALESINKKYGVMCKILQQRLAPVEKLMQNIDQNKTKSEPNMSKLGTDGDVFTNLNFYGYLKRQLKDVRIGFTASDGTGHGSVENYRSVYFYNVECEIQTLFDEKTGRFIVPVDGIYTLSLSAKQINEEFVSSYYIIRRSQGIKTSQSFCNIKDGSFETCVVWLKSGDELWVSQTGSYGHDCTFSCYLNGF